MKNIYLIRHGKPDFPCGKRMCLGRTDLPLCKEGFSQARAAAEILKDKHFEVFSSPLLRAVQTAEAFSKPVTIIDDLQELYAGLWDGLSFEKIKLRYPELYAARGSDKSLPLPGAEGHAEGLARFYNAMIKAAELAENDLAVVAHGGIIGLFLEKISGEYFKPDYCQIVYLTYENNKFNLIGGTKTCEN